MDCCQLFLTLSLLMALVFRTDHHDFAVSLDHFALVAHGFDGRSYFHIVTSMLFFSRLLADETNNRNELKKAVKPIRSTKRFA